MCSTAFKFCFQIRLAPLRHAMSYIKAGGRVEFAVDAVLYAAADDMVGLGFTI